MSQYETTVIEKDTCYVVIGGKKAACCVVRIQDESKITIIGTHRTMVVMRTEYNYTI